MSKLNEIVFKPIIIKEFEVFGQKITLRSLTTKDNIELDLRTDLTNVGMKETLDYAIKILSRSITKINDITPDNSEEIIQLLLSQGPDVVFAILEKYNEVSGVATTEELKK